MLSSSRRSYARDLKRSRAAATPRKPAGTSWVCDSLQSSVFSEAKAARGGAGAAPPPPPALPAAGVPRERVTSAARANNIFFDASRPARSNESPRSFRCSPGPPLLKRF